MTHLEIMTDLANKGLRIADENEAGWYERYPGGVRLWVTDN